jgi:hypothetical protein
VDPLFSIQDPITHSEHITPSTYSFQPSSNFSHYKSHVLSYRSDVLRIARKFLVNEQLSRSSPSGSRGRNRADCLMEVEVEPYRAVLDNAMSVVELQGMAACHAFNR